MFHEEGIRKQKDRKYIEKHTYEIYRKANSCILAAFRYKFQEEGKIKGCTGLILSLKYPLAFLGLPHRWNFWSFDKSEAVLGKSGARLLCADDWQTL